MTSKFAITVATSLCTLLLMAGVADAKGGSGNSGGSSSSSSSRSTYNPPARNTESKKSDTKSERHEPRVVKSEPKILVRKHEPKVEQKTTKVEPKAIDKTKIADKSKVTDQNSSRINKVALNPQPLPPKGKIVAASATAGSGRFIMTHMMSTKNGPTAPRADRNNHVSSASMAKFVTENSMRHNVKTVTPSDGIAKHREAVQHATQLIKDPTKGYQVATYGDKSKPGQPGKPAQGDNSTIVINGNNKTVYVPASNVSGPDRRTIVVNCNHCKVVIVGDTAKNGQAVVDQRNIIVNGSHDKVVLQGDKANGANGTGQAGGSVTDGRHVTVNGDKNNIKVAGDSVNGGSGANSGTGRGQDGGNGGKVTDTRTVDITQSGDKNKVTMGGDSANGGNGGNGKTAGGNGGTGGNVTDKRDVNDEGNKNKVDTSRTDTANGGNGGSGMPTP